MAKATIIHPGFYSSIQDLGRLNYRNIGVPQSGAMDMETATMLNKSLGNTPEDAILEMITIGVTLIFNASAYLSVSQNVDQVYVNDFSVDFSKIVKIKNGDHLKIGRVTTGNFIYVAIAGGWQTEKVLGSRSMYAGITNVSRLSVDDFIAYESVECDVDLFRFRESDTTKSNLISVFEGPEFHLLPEAIKKAIFEKELIVSKSWNRMAFNASTDLKVDLQQIKTAPVTPGMVQFTPNGELLFLMRDAQTTGGYPRILQLTEDALVTMVQLQPGSSFQLKRKFKSSK